MKGIIKYSDILELSNFLKDKEYKDSIEIINFISDRKTLDTINDDFFYRLNDGNTDKPTYSDEIVLNVDGVRYTYKVKAHD